jgi:hypothetical protein
MLRLVALHSQCICTTYATLNTRLAQAHELTLDSLCRASGAVANSEQRTRSESWWDRSTNYCWVELRCGAH